MEDSTSSLIFFVNGVKVEEKAVDPEWTLIYYLRNKLGLTGTKVGCSEGGCGACTVMVSKVDQVSGEIRHFALNSCLAPVCSVHGLAVTTVEGIGSSKTKLHPVQERIAQSFGSQCGFCTPGFVMSMYSLLRSSGKPPSPQQLEEAFQGNLCRCTGYRPILEAFKGFAQPADCVCGKGKCCRDVEPASLGTEGDSTEFEVRFDKEKFIPFDTSQEAIFPPELQLSRALDETHLHFRGERSVWLRPVTLQGLLQVKALHPDARIVCGNTEVGIELKFKNALYPVMITPTHVPEMNRIQKLDDGLEIGGAVTLNEMRYALQTEVEKEPEYKTRFFAAVIEMLRWFAGDQIRNVASVAGNIMTASPISDLNPLFLAASCKVRVACKEGSREILMDESFFCGYRKTCLKNNEVLLSITLPYTEKNECIFSYKLSPRREDDIAIVNAGMYACFTNGKVQQLRLAFGGMAPRTVLATGTAAALIGRDWNESVVATAGENLFEELKLKPDVPGGMARYRQTLTASFFLKFFLQSKQQLELDTIASREMSATLGWEFRDFKSTQMWKESDEAPHPVGLSMPLVSGNLQATGEARYVDDMPPFREELYAAVVFSSRAHAKILSVDASDALRMPGVVRYVDHRDVNGCNQFDDEFVFAENEVTTQGQVIGMIVADTQTQAQRAAKNVTVNYEDIEPIIITTEDAIAKNSFFGETRSLCRGDPESAMTQCEMVVEGTAKSGAQEHFYLETQGCICVPKQENGEMDVFCTTQSPTHCQEDIAKTLGVPFNRINVKVKRLGGGFGGKETAFNILSRPLAVAAQTVGRPVRCMLDRDEDMISTGNRHPTTGKYKVGFDKEGNIKALIADLYNNCGHCKDRGQGVMDRALFHIENAYFIPNLRATGRLCKTNLPRNTAFRGFGAPPSMFVTETIISHVASALGMPPEQIRERNLYHGDQSTHFGQSLDGCPLRRVWQQCLKNSDFSCRQKQVARYNQEHRWKKKGIAVVPTKYGVAVTILNLNQGGALVHAYTDGSVLLSHGGTEMGQGLYTKMIQVASSVLRIPPSRIFTSETNTACVPNTSPTAASTGSDLNGMAVMQACEKLWERLAPFRQAAPDAGWDSWVRAAYDERVSLSATGFYRTPDIGFDWKTKTGKPYNYFSCGACCCEVEIDCLTGDHQIIRADMVMDVGASLNPSIDVGQVEGAFTQGYGLFTMEQQKFTPCGRLLSRGPGMYKMPALGNVPREVNVALLESSKNPRAVYSSKAVGEPPLFLSSAVFFAIRAAIRAARQETGNDEYFRLDAPATTERIRLACTDQFTKKLAEPEAGSFAPWFVEP